MHVLLIHQYFLEQNDSGGSRWNEMTRLWEELGCRTTVIAGMTHYSTGIKHARYKGKYIYQEQESAKKIRVLRSHVSEKYNSNFYGRLRGYISFLFSSIFTGIFKARDKYDIVIVTSPPLFVGIAGYILSRWKRVPYVFEVRDLWPESAIDSGIVKNKLIINLSYAVEKFIYRKAAIINVLTPAFEEVLKNRKGIPASKIICIPNAADFSLSEDLLHSFDAGTFRNQLGWGDKFVVCYVGAHGVANHLIQLIDAAERMRDENVLFVLIGDGMQKNMLRSTARQKDLTNVQFIDAVPKAEIFKYILACDAGTSVLMKNDTFKTVYSNKTFDYLSCKKPVIMVIDGISRKLIEESDGGIFAEPENTEDLCAKIKFYMLHPEVVRRQGENGYAYVKKYFDRTSLAEKYLSILRERNKKEN